MKSPFAITLFALCLLHSALADGPMPPAPQPVVWYASAFAFDGTNISNSGTPEVSWTGQAQLEIWPYNYTNRVAILIGRRSYSYTRMIDAGTNHLITWPPTPALPVYQFYYAGQFVTTSTSQPAPAFFKAFPGSNFVNIGISTDNITFAPFKIFQLPGLPTNPASQTFTLSKSR